MFRYYPAVGGEYLGFTIEKKYFFWLEEGIVYHPYVLISYGIFKDKILDDQGFRPDDYVERYRIREAKEIITDSGGFQVAVNNAKIDPAEVYTWQFRWGDIIIPLDYPPMAYRTGLRETISFNKSIEKTRESLEYFLRFASSRKVENKKLYAIHHGASLTDYMRWDREVLHDLIDSFDGIAIATRPTWAWQASMLARMWVGYKGYKNVHYLGVSAKDTLIPLLYNNMKYRLSSDTSTWATHKGRGNAFAPLWIFSADIGRRGGKITDMSSLPCHCPACEYARRYNVSSPFTLSNTINHMLVALHNLFWMLNYVDALIWLDRYGRLRDYALEEYGFDLSPIDCVEETGDIEKCYYGYPKLSNYLDSISLTPIKKSKGWW